MAICELKAGPRATLNPPQPWPVVYEPLSCKCFVTGAQIDDDRQCSKAEGEMEFGVRETPFGAANH